MSQIMKAFMGIFMILFMMVTVTGILGAFFQVSYAQNLYAVVVDELENSDYAPKVLKECFEVAELSGYEMDITLYPENDPYMKVDETEDIPNNVDTVTMARVHLKYPLEIAFFGIHIEQEIYGYAR